MLAYLDKDFTAAREAVLQQLRATPEDLRGLLLAGAIELELKSYSQAEMYAQKVVGYIPQQRLARRILVMSYLRNGQPDRALDAIKPMLSNVGNDPIMLALAGEVFMSNGEPLRASEYFTRAAAINPEDPRMRTSLALSRIAAGDTERGVHDLEQAASSDSNARSDLALIATYTQRGQYDKAMSAA
jgi:predicted Zn-dependent protease